MCFLLLRACLKWLWLDETLILAVIVFLLLLASIFKFLKIVRLNCEQLRLLIFIFLAFFRVMSLPQFLLQVVVFIPKVYLLHLFLSFKHLARLAFIFLPVPFIFSRILFTSFPHLSMIFCIAPAPTLFFFRFLQFAS